MWRFSPLAIFFLTDFRWDPKQMDRKQIIDCIKWIKSWIESQKNKTSAKDLGDGRRSRSSGRIYGLKQVCVLLAEGRQHTLVFSIYKNYSITLDWRLRAAKSSLFNHWTEIRWNDDDVQSKWAKKEKMDSIRIRTTMKYQISKIKFNHS